MVPLMQGNTGWNKSYEYAMVMTPPVRPVTSAKQRRSQRIVLSVQLLITGKRAGGPPLSEETTTLIVSAHGALIMMREPVVINQVLTLKNLATTEEIVCTVIDIGEGANGVREIGVEFAGECSRFWRVSFPPADWSPRGAEAKQHVQNKKLDPSGLAAKNSTFKK